MPCILYCAATYVYNEPLYICFVTIYSHPNIYTDTIYCIYTSYAAIYVSVYLCMSISVLSILYKIYYTYIHVLTYTQHIQCILIPYTRIG